MHKSTGVYKINSKRIFILVVLIFLSISLANYFLPYGCSAPSNLDTFLSIVSITLFFLVFGILGLLAKSRKIKVPYIFLLFIFYIPVVASAGIRNGAITKEYWVFSGAVEERASSNRNVKSITIANIKYSSFPKHIWKDISLGDVVSKKECSNTIKVNEQNYTI